MSKCKKTTKTDETYTKIFWYYNKIKKDFKEANGEEACRNMSNKFFYMQVADVFGKDWNTIDTIIRRLTKNPPKNMDEFIVVTVKPCEL